MTDIYHISKNEQPTSYCFTINHTHMTPSKDITVVCYNNIQIQCSNVFRKDGTEIDVYYRNTYIHLDNWIPILSKILDLIAFQNIEYFKFENPIWTIEFNYDIEEQKGTLFIYKA